ncbi:MAG: hypothetical protein DRN19_03850, partial [Thermoplasmata archaeon]
MWVKVSPPGEGTSKANFRLFAPPSIPRQVRIPGFRQRKKTDDTHTDTQNHPVPGMDHPVNRDQIQAEDSGHCDPTIDRVADERVPLFQFHADGLSYRFPESTRPDSLVKVAQIALIGRSCQQRGYQTDEGRTANDDKKGDID